MPETIIKKEVPTRTYTHGQLVVAGAEVRAQALQVDLTAAVGEPVENTLAKTGMKLVPVCCIGECCGWKIAG